MNANTPGRIVAALRIAPPLLYIIGSMAEPAIANEGIDYGSSDNQEVLTDSCDLLYVIKNWLFNIVYILGACGLVIIAVTAFLGKFKFAHLISLAGGLFVVAMADLLIGFITGGAENACSASYSTN